MRRAKMYVTDIRPKDRISKTREGQTESVFHVRNMGRGEWEVMITRGGVEATYTVPVTRMFWIEIP